MCGALLAGLAAATVGPVAQAADGAVTDGVLSVGPVSMTLTNDVNSNGRPDIGDTVTISADVTAVGENTVLEYLSYIDSSGGNRLWAGVSEFIPADTTVRVDVPRVIAFEDLEPLGTGPAVTAVRFNHRRGVVDTGFLTAPAPPYLYDAGPAISTTTTYTLIENGGTADGLPTEGDTIVFGTRFANESEYALTLDNLSGYQDPFGSHVIMVNSALVLTGKSYTVTRDDVIAGSLTLPTGTAQWHSGWEPGTPEWSVTFTIDPVTIATEPLTVSSSASVVTELNDTDGNPVALADVEPGDVIDFTLGLTNHSNVTLSAVALSKGPTWGAGIQSIGTSIAHVKPGASLPTATFNADRLTSKGTGLFAPYVITATDISRGYVDLDWWTAAAPTQALMTANSNLYKQTLAKRVLLREYSLALTPTFTAALNDSNGDGIGNAGETVSFRWSVTNDSNQDVVLTNIGVRPGADPVATYPGASNLVVAVGDTAADEWDYTLTVTDEARGTVNAGVSIEYAGAVSLTTDTIEFSAPTIVTGPYVAPATTLDTSATYVDTNGDGHPSIGETVTVTVSVANNGTYALAGLVVGDAPGSNISGLLSPFPTTVASGASASRTFTHILTATDYQRGSLTYSTHMTATGLPTTTSATSVNLTGITFAAYASDLDGVLPDGVTVCGADGVPLTTVAPGARITVVPGTDCAAPGSATDFHVVAFSTPVVLGVGTFDVTLPLALGEGSHRIALYKSGVLVGYSTLTIERSGGLAVTGPRTDLGLQAWAAAALIVVGAAFITRPTPRRW